MRSIFLLLALIPVFAGCNGQQNQQPSETTVPDTLMSTAPAHLPKLQGDDELNRAARFYAGISADGIEMNDVQQKAWDTYTRRIGQARATSYKTLAKVDTLVSRDMQSMRDRATLVMYPFSGPDFLYPITIFPNADVYFMCGLERTGTALRDIYPDAEHFQPYTSALNIYMRSSFFRTNSMRNDLHSEEIDGIVPVLTMLMAMKGYEVIDINHLTLAEDGSVTTADRMTNFVKVRFFNPTTPTHEQTIYYFSGNVANSGIDSKLCRFLDQLLPKYEVASYLKAASYLMHETYFGRIRDYILNYSFAVLQDDSGIPYRFFKDQWDLTFYGKYVHPVSIFRPHAYQTDLQALYDSIQPRPLPFRIGYNNPSNWMYATKKASN